MTPGEYYSFGVENSDITSISKDLFANITFHYILLSSNPKLTKIDSEAFAKLNNFVGLDFKSGNRLRNNSYFDDPDVFSLAKNIKSQAVSV